MNYAISLKSTSILSTNHRQTCRVVPRVAIPTRKSLLRGGCRDCGCRPRCLRLRWKRPRMRKPAKELYANRGTRYSPDLSHSVTGVAQRNRCIVLKHLKRNRRAEAECSNRFGSPLKLGPIDGGECSLGGREQFAKCFRNRRFQQIAAFASSSYRPLCSSLFRPRDLGSHDTVGVEDTP